MKILELFTDPQEAFASDFMQGYKQENPSAAAKAPAATTASGPFAKENPKVLKQALAAIINGQQLDPAAIQMFTRVHKNL